MVVFEVGTPKRTLIVNKQEYIDFIKDNHGIHNLYETIYKFKYTKTKYSPDYDSAIIDQMFFDCDSKNALKVAITFHKYLIKQNIKHYMKQSSYLKFHIFVLCNGEIENKKNTLLNAMLYLAKEAGLTVGKTKEFDLDIATFGDLARLTAIAGTYKPTRKKWCNYINEKDLFDESRLKEKSENAGGRKLFYGENIFDLTPFENKNNHIFNTNEVLRPSTPFNIKFDDKHINLLPPFLKKVLIDYNNHGNWENRWRFAIWCRDYGFEKEWVNSIAKKYFSKQKRTDSLENNYKHFVKVKVLDSVYSNGKYHFPIDTIISEGWEIEKEDIDFYKELYY